MADNPNSGYYQSGKGSLTGFDQLNLPTGNPVLATTGWSIEQLRNFLLNQNAMNFPSNEWLQRIEQAILDHQNDFDNPHRTTLDQIVGNFTRQVLGNITPGTVPESAPFFAFDAGLGLPIETIFPATYTANNLYRRTAGGWLADIGEEEDAIATDYITGKAGIPLFSAMTNVTPVTWATDTTTRLNTTLVEAVDLSINYPFEFYEVRENPVIAMFGVDLPVTQDLQVTYTTSFFIMPVETISGKVRIYQPGDINNYIEVMLETGEILFYTDAMIGSAIRHIDGVIRVSVSYTSLLPTPDEVLRIVHIDDGAAGDGTRIGSNGRHIFTIAHPQSTIVTIDQPVIKDLSAPAATSTFVPNLTAMGVPATLSTCMLTMALYLNPQIDVTTVVDPTILTFGNLIVTRDQTQIIVAVNGTILFTSDILSGLNKITISYSPNMVLFKDLANDRQSVAGTFAPLDTTAVSFGPFGGYLCNFAFYAQADTQETIEYLTNG